MRLLQSPNRWSCLITSAAMILDSTVEELVDELGHGGSEIWWPSLPEPLCRRAFHIQEIIDLCLNRQIALVPIELAPASAPSGHSNLACLLPDTNKRKHALMRYFDRKGILVGVGPNGGAHAVAWGDGMVHDPIGRIYSIEHFQIQTFWMANPIRL